MAGDFGEDIAVSLVPDFRRFDEEYRAKIGALERDGISVPVHFDTAKTRAELRRTLDEAARGMSVTVKVRFDIDQASLARAQAAARVGGGAGGGGGGGGAGGGGAGGGAGGGGLGGTIVAGGILGAAAIAPSVVGGITGLTAALGTAQLAYQGLQAQAAKGVGFGQFASNDVKQLKQELAGLADVAANAIGPGLLEGFGKLETILPTLVPDVQKMGAALGQVASHLAGGIGNALKAASPLFDAFDSTMVSLSADFEKFTGSQEFKTFMDNAAQQLPVVVNIIEQLGTAFVNLSNAVAPVATMLLNVADALAKVVNALPSGLGGAVTAAGLGAYLFRGSGRLGAATGLGSLRGAGILGGVALAGSGLGSQHATGSTPLNYLQTVGGTTATGALIGGAPGALVGFVGGNIAYAANSFFGGGPNKTPTRAGVNQGGSFFDPKNPLFGQPGAWGPAFQSMVDLISVPRNIRVGAGDLGFTKQQQQTIFAGTGSNLLTYSDTPGAGKNLSTVQQAGLAGAALDTTMSRYQPALSALDQYQTAQKNVGQAVRDENRTEVQGAQQVSAAQQLLQNARHQAAESAIADAAAIKNAQQALHNAEEQQADDAHSSAEAIISATKSVTRAQEDAADAQKNLTQTRKDAARQLQDYARAAVDSGDSFKSAQLQLQQLQLNQAARTGSKTPEQIFAEQNQIDTATNKQDLKSASDAVTDAQITHTRAVEDNNTAQRKGVEGSDQVVQAKKNLKTANDNVAQSEQNLADTKHAAARTEEHDAQNVATAVTNLETARRTAANDRKTNEQNVATAVAGVATAETNAKQANDDATQRTKDAKKAAGDAAYNFDQEAAKIGLSRQALLDMAKAIKDHKLDVQASFAARNQNPVARVIVDMQRQVEVLTLIAQGQSPATAEANAAKAFPYPAGSGATPSPPKLPRGGQGQSWYFASNAATGGPVNGPGGPTDDVIPKWLSAGEHVWTAKEVANAGGHKAIEAMRHFYGGMAEGGPVGPTIDFKKIGFVKDLQNALKAHPPAPTGGGGTPPSAGTYTGSRNWSTLVASTITQLHSPSSADAVLARIAFESGGNPNIVNTTDSNWFAGHPSVGLLQVIRSTFQGNAGPYRSVGPFKYGVSVDPQANIYAGIHYADRRYGGMPDPRITHQGYDNGGFLPPGVTLAVNQSRKPEAVLSEPQWRILRSLARGRGGAVQHVETQIIQTPAAADMLVRMLQFASHAGGGSL